MREAGGGRTVRILGTHGVPAAQGGFETAAENVALYLRERGWRVIVYCHVVGGGGTSEDRWNGIERVLIPVAAPGLRGTILYDLRSILHACRHRDLCLTFGYNTAVFNVAQRLLGIPNVINMDGIEWERKNWSLAVRALLYINERIACTVGDRLIADHPQIESHLASRAPRRKLSMIAYGAHPVVAPSADFPAEYGLQPGRYLTIIARPVPENSILEIVEGFSRRRRGVRLVILGDYDALRNRYHRAVLQAASDEVVFLGAIFQRERVASLRYHGIGYLHGHTVGGTNPSLVEALAAGNPVIAHDNPYNRWVAGDAALYFKEKDGVATALETLLASPEKRALMKAAGLRRHAEEFTWDRVAGQYEALLLRCLAEA